MCRHDFFNEFFRFMYDKGSTVWLPGDYGRVWIEWEERVEFLREWQFDSSFAFLIGSWCVIMGTLTKVSVQIWWGCHFCVVTLYVYVVYVYDMLCMLWYLLWCFYIKEWICQTTAAEINENGNICEILLGTNDQGMTLPPFHSSSVFLSDNIIFDVLAFFTCQ